MREQKNFCSKADAQKTFTSFCECSYYLRSSVFSQKISSYLCLVISLTKCAVLMHSRGEVRYGSASCFQQPLGTLPLRTFLYEHDLLQNILGSGERWEGGCFRSRLRVTAVCLLSVGSFGSSDFWFIVIFLDSGRCRDLDWRESVMAGVSFRQMSGRVVQSRVEITQG